MYKIAVLGDPDSVLGFTALGLKAVPVYDEADAKKKFREISLSGEYAVIYVTDNYYQCLSEQIDRFKDKVAPAIILIPGAGGSTGLGKKTIDDAIKRAIGADII